MSPASTPLAIQRNMSVHSAPTVGNRAELSGPAPGEAAQLLTFQTRGRWYACDLLWIREILRQPALTVVDRAPRTIRGLINLRGQILTALDLDRRLGHPAETDEAPRHCLVFKTIVELARLSRPPADTEMAGPDLLGIIVDQVGDILANTHPPLPPPPDTLSLLDPACIAGVLPRPEGLVTVLNVGALLSIPAHAST